MPTTSDHSLHEQSSRLRVAGRSRSKVELVNFLIKDCDLYLPKAREMITTQWIKDLLAERRMAIRKTDLAAVERPKQIQGLRNYDLKEFLEAHRLEKYLPPNQPKADRADRKWLYMLCGNLKPKEYTAMLREAELKLQTQQSDIVTNKF